MRSLSFCSYSEVQKNVKDIFNYFKEHKEKIE